MYFTPDDWQRTIETYESWWDGTLKRPLILARHCHKSVPQINRGNCGDFGKPAEEVINEIEYNISHTDCYGDAYPFIYWGFFGAGTLASYLGSPVEPRGEQNTVWMHPLPGNKELKDIHLTLDPKNPWYNRCKDLYWASVKKFRGKVVIGMNDLGGELDVLASLVGTERLLYCLMDEPEEVGRLCDEVHELWLKVYWEFMSILSENNCMFTDWLGLLSKEPYYTQQCDFSYMIGPKHFDAFVLPYLKKTSRELTHSLYHLDGKGELPHLDKIMSIDKIQAIQWQPGDGAGFGYKWIDIYRHIRAAGKKMHIISSNEDFIKIAGDIGGEGLYFPTGFDSYEEMKRFMDIFGVKTDISGGIK